MFKKTFGGEGGVEATTFFIALHGSHFDCLLQNIVALAYTFLFEVTN